MGKIVTPQFSLFDPKDDYFLQLKPEDKKNLPEVFSDFVFATPEMTLENIVMYSYENIAFACKVFLNLDILPYQVAALSLMFEKQFPMIIGSRGFSKCIKDAYIITDDGIKYINDLFNESDPYCEHLPVGYDIYGENGFKRPSYKWKNKPEELNKIITDYGYSLSCTKNHPIRIVRDGEIKWINSDDVCNGDYIPIDRSKEWFNNTNDLPEDLAYLFGCLVGDGGYTVRGHITITSEDDDLLDNVSDISEKYFGKPFKPQKEQVTRLLCGVDIWDRLFDEYGFNSSVCGEKRFPESVMSASKESMSSFLRGLFDTDGYVTKRGLIAGYCSKSRRLVEEIQFILTKFGIISNLYISHNKKYKNDYYHLNFCGEDVKIFAKEIGFGIKRKQKILKNHLNIECNTNKDIVPMELFVDDFYKLFDKFKNTEEYKKIKRSKRRMFYLKTLDQNNISYKKLKYYMNYFKCLSNEEEYIKINKIIENNYFYDVVKKVDSDYGETYDFYIPDDHSFISNGFISHNSFLLAVFSILKAILYPNTKIVIISASFRQAKTVFNYINDIYKKSVVLQQLCGRGNHPKFDISACFFNIGSSKITCLPLGDGERIRGERANCVDGNTLIETTKGLIRIKDSYKYMDDPKFEIYSGNGDNKFCPENFMKTKPMDGYEITFEKGYSIKCSEVHGIHTIDGVKTPEELVVGDTVEFVNNYEFPSEKIKYKDIILDENLAWIMGVLVAEGSINDKHAISVTSTDFSYSDRLKKSLKKIKTNSKVSEYDRDSYICRYRGWDCKATKVIHMCNLEFRNKTSDLGLERKTAREKTIPWSILQSPKEVVVAFLSGLFEGDGSCFHYKDTGKDKTFGVAYYTGSIQLAKELAVLLKKFDIECSFLTRASKISDKPNYILRFYGINALRMYELLKIEKWKELYDTRRKNIIYNKEKFKLKVRKIERLSEKQEFYDYTIPEDHSFMGNGIKNRNCVLVDEFGSLNEEIFQVVVRGFGAVSQDPITKVKEKYRLENLASTGTDVSELNTTNNNQIILSGTARYQFNHFYSWYKRYLKIIACKNDKDKLKSIMGDEVTDEEIASIDTREFSILQVSYRYIPILDESMLAQAKATMTTAQFEMEYGAKFWADSDGFIPMSLLNAVSIYQPYSPLVMGDSSKRYIMGVDPARKRDHFSIVLIEIDDSIDKQHKIVYCWATNEKKMKKSGEVNANQGYYDACARKIRQIIKRFNIVQIMMDSGGGGFAIAEILSDSSKLKAGEKQIWEADNPEHRMYEGDHLLKLISSNPKWSSEANHALRKSIEDFRLLFPSFDSADIEKDMKSNPQLYLDKQIDKSINKVRNFMSDSLEDVSFETDSLKDEISSIVITQTQSGSEHFDLPKLDNAKKASDTRRKDRYSACLLAHWGIQDLVTDEISSNYRNYGGNADDIPKNVNAPMYRGLPAGTRYTSGSSINVSFKSNGGSVVY